MQGQVIEYLPLNANIKRDGMPKIKTHKSTSKRFRLTGSGKLMRTRLGKSHLRRKKSKRVMAELPECMWLRRRVRLSACSNWRPT